MVYAIESPLSKQWGHKINSSTQQVTFTYPIEFTVKAFSGSVNYDDAAGTADIGINNLGKTSMTVEIDASKTVSKNVCWFAIGY